ncbi:MAG: hypothetical protein JRF33_26000 [Deltaproteobacteria bacterium]|nr:hypothetical protein [Deltaproteobacteria bacterium]
MVKATSRKAAFCIIALFLANGGFAYGRSLELFDSWSFAAHGGLESLDFYNAGLQVLTLDGPGDSGLIMFHLGYGLDLDYAHDGEGLHHLRIVPTVELFFFLLYVQAGLGPFVDLEDSDRWGVNLMFNFGLRIFLGDEYQWPSIAVGGRLDYMVAEDYAEFVPSFMAMVSFYLD